jgi:hypothetical protein
MSFKTYKEILEEKGWADYEKQALLEEFTLNKLTEEIKENFDIVLPDSLLTALHTKDGNLVEKENPFVDFALLYQEKVIKEGREEEYRAKFRVGEQDKWELDYFYTNAKKKQEVKSIVRVLVPTSPVKKTKKYYELTKKSNKGVLSCEYDDFRELYTTLIRIIFRDVVQKPNKVTVQTVAKTIGRALLRQKAKKRKTLLEKREVDLDLEEVKLQKMAFTLGEMLLEIFEEATKIIKIEKTKKWSGENEVTVNVKKIHKFFKDKFYQRLITPTFFPMLHKPIDWELEKRGGHFYNAVLIPGEGFSIFNGI